MRSLLFNLIRVPLAALFAVSIVSSAFAQEEQIKTLAAFMVESIAQSKNEDVLVFDFASVQPNLKPLASAWSADFDSALATSGPTLQFKGRDGIKKMMDDSGLDLDDFNIDDPDIASWLAAAAGAQAIVVGTLDRRGKDLKLRVASYDVQNSEKIAIFEADIPLTDEMKKQFPDVPEDKSRRGVLRFSPKCVPSSSMPCGDMDGYSGPKCIHCPSPPFPKEAPAEIRRVRKQRKFEGAVVLTIVVDESGTGKDIKVVKFLPYGLTPQAIQTVQNWTFQPAIGPNGKPATTRQVVIVTFHLY